MNRRWYDVAVAVGLAVALIGGALLYVDNRHLAEDARRATEKAQETADTNSHFICTFGAAISARPLAPRAGESAKDFRLRVEQTRAFVKELSSELMDCPKPTVIVIDPEGKDELRDTRRGGGRQQSGNSPVQQEGPSGGSQGNSGHGGNRGPRTPQTASEPVPAPVETNQGCIHGNATHNPHCVD